MKMSAGVDGMSSSDYISLLMMTNISIIKSVEHVEV